MSANANQKPEDFYIVAREPGAEHPAIPTWASESINPARVNSELPVNIERVEMESVPGAFQLLNVLTRCECQQLIDLTESLGYLPDAAVSLPRSVRHQRSECW